MSDVNSWLADYYGTEKTAAAGDESEIWHLFKAAAAEDGIDAEALDDEEIDALADYYMDEDEGDDLPPNWDGDDVEHYNYLDDAEKTAFVQFKEAEFLGQVMAHSMDAELSKLAGVKEMRDAGMTKDQIRAALKGQSAGSAGPDRSANVFKGKAGKANRKMRKAQAKSQRLVGIGHEKARDAAGRRGRTAGGLKMEAGMRARGAGKVLGKNLSRHGGKYLGVAGLGLGAAGLRQMNKSAGAYWTLAEVRANDFIKHAEAGYEYPLYEGDPIDEMAYELLEEHGYI